MMDKGYPFPLYSLDLAPPGALLPDEARYALPVPAGRLVVSPALRRRGEHASTGACEDGVALGLSRHRLAPAAFGALGLDEGWVAGLRHFRERMIVQHLLCVSIEAEDAAAAARRRDRVEDGRRLWGRLTLAARLAGLRGLSGRGAAPWRGDALIEGLREAAARARPHAEALARHGFGAAETAELDGLLAAAASTDAPERRQRRAAAQAQLVVLRAALLGDLALFGQAAAAVLLPQQAQPLQRRQLLGRRRVA